MTQAQVQHRLTQMRRAFPAAEVVGYQDLGSAMTCHPKDRHVLAAAVHARCEVLVTFNLTDFPQEATGAFDIAVLSLDTFLLDQLDLYPAHVGRALVQRVDDAANPPLTTGHCWVDSPRRSPCVRRRSPTAQVQRAAVT